MTSIISPWDLKIQSLKIFMDKNECLPNRKEHSLLFSFLSSTQYNNKVNREHLTEWEHLRKESKYAPYFTMDIEKYQLRLAPLKQFLITHKRKPDKSRTEKPLILTWRQLKKRHFYGFYNNAEEIYNLYIEFLNDPRFGHFFGRKTIDWMPKFNALVEYIENNQTLPTNRTTMKWYSRQLKECKSSNPLYPTEVSAAWEKFVSSPLHQDAIDSSSDES
tara:strand:+ start:55 stop:708 length:654 start_codon:yes stop_codon:yes gene_type:complete